MKRFTPFRIYLISMLFTIIYVPTLERTGRKIWDLNEWKFIWNLYSHEKIYIEYVLIEILVLSLIYFAYLYSKKNK